MAIQRVSVSPESGGTNWIEPSRDGQFVEWTDVAQLMIDISGLVARIELSHDLHAVFTIKDSQEFKKVKEALADVFKA